MPFPDPGAPNTNTTVQGGSDALRDASLWLEDAPSDRSVAASERCTLLNDSVVAAAVARKSTTEKGQTESEKDDGDE